MKKIFFGGMFVVSALSSQISAQTMSGTTQASTPSGFYVGINTGYNLPISTKDNSYFEPGNYTNATSGNDRAEVVGFSLGKGANFGINLGYMFTSHIGAELGVDYLLGSKTKIYEYRNENNPDYTEEQTLEGRMVQIKPAVLISANSGKVNPYAKVGVVLGVGSKILSEYQEREPDDANYTYDYNEEYSGGTAVGFHGALGLDFAINNQITLFGEIRGTSLNYSPTKGKVTKDMEDGVDYLPEYDVIDREFEFVDVVYDEDNVDSSQPEKRLKFSTPFSSVGLNVGVKFKF